MDNENNKDLLEIKTVLLGEAGVGKTSIIKQYTKNEFNSEIESSISGQYNSKQIFIKEIDKKIKFDLWDTAGQEIYRSLAKIFYQDAKIIIFVYDITNKKSFEGIKKYWHKQVLSSSNTNPILALVGNKSDLYDDQEVKEEDAITYAESIGAIFQTTSAKSNTGIDMLFKNVGRKYVDPDFDYKAEEDNDKELYNIKKEKKNKIKKEQMFNNDENDTSITSTKLYNDINTNKNKKRCC